MNLDIVSVLLGVIIVLLFMSIFSLLRTMSSPFIKRFESIIKARLTPLDNLPGCFHAVFQYNQQEFELVEVKHRPSEGANRVYNNYVYLRIKTNGKFSLRFRDAHGQVFVEYILDQLHDRLAAHAFGELRTEHLHFFYKDFYLMTDNPAEAEKFLNKNEVRLTLSDFKTQISFYGYLIPFVIEPGFITLDYSLTAYYLNELINDPRNIKKHADALIKLAAELGK